MTEPLVFPIGQHGGGFRPRASGDWRFTVRRGAEVLTLTGDQHLAWLAAHGSTKRVAETVWTRPAVLALAGEFGLADPAATYTQLVDWGLVAEAPPEGTDAVAFAAGHQMVPLTYGLGNSADQPDWYGLGFPPKPWVSVPFPVWWLWQEGHLEASLWDACQSIARRERRPGTAVVARVEPHRLLSYAL